MPTLDRLATEPRRNPARPGRLARHKRPLDPDRFAQLAITLDSKDGAVMTRLPIRTRSKAAEKQAIVWIDHDWAVIVGHGADGRDNVAVLDRMPAETKATFDVRAIEELVDQERIVVSGPAHARTGFERLYTAMTHRPDRLVDVEPITRLSRSLHRTA
jgi:hypothetical protein